MQNLNSEILYTRAEQSIINKVLEGQSNAVIATKLDCREITVKNHLTNIYKKAGVVGRAEFIVQFYKRVVEAREFTIRQLESVTILSSGTVVLKATTNCADLGV